MTREHNLQRTKGLLPLAVAALCIPITVQAGASAFTGASTYVTLQSSDAVEQLKSGRITSDLKKAHYASIAPDGQELLVTSIDTGQVFQVDAMTGKTEATFDIGDKAQGVKVSPDGKLALAIEPKKGVAAVIDLNDQAVIKEIPVGKTPHNARFTADGKTAYVTLQGEGGIAVVDMERLVRVRKIPIQGMSQPHNLDLSDDGSRLWVRDFTGKVAVLDLERGSVLETFEVGSSHGGIDVIPGGKYVATTAIGSDTVTILDQQRLEKVTELPVGKAPHGIRADADGKQLYVSLTGDREVAIIDTESMKVVKNARTGGDFPFWITVKDNP
ncbi:YncE family protein [Guyparkeria hydrothermalis]|uniref:YncE family protein n=1 Tax=Guyparkeria hydrothermalis TaxID=923 RepID=UPI0020216571|nr:YncE family protein [Guyparkeria hydrothermalis]MCL7745259.1 YncE family protein [Guyparkeria hydrothermalis]